MQARYDVSVVIPCYNGAARIHRQLDALCQQTVQGFEVVVADNRSTDDTAAVVQEYASTRELPYSLRVVDASGARGINHARNVGTQSSHGEYILLCDDDDDAVSPDWVETMSDALRSRCDCVGGEMVRTRPDGTVLDTQPGVDTRHWPGRAAPLMTATGANCGFRRSTYEQIGGFDETFSGGGDEQDFFYRASLAGLTMEMTHAQVAYYIRQSLSETFHQYFRYGKGSVRLHKKFAAQGMPRDPWWKPPAAIGVYAVGALFPRRSSFKRLSVERLATRLGRISGSLELRHVYL